MFRRDQDKAIDILSGETKFNYSFMKKQIDKNPKYFYDLLFDKDGKYNEEYDFKPWVIDQLALSIVRNTKDNYGYNYQIEQDEASVYNKAIAELIEEILHTSKWNKKTIDLLNNVSYGVREKFDIQSLPIPQLLKEGYEVNHNLLTKYFELVEDKSIEVIFQMYKSSSFPSEVFREYIIGLSDEEIQKLIDLGFEINHEILNWYIYQVGAKENSDFSYERFDIFISSSINVDVTSIYENLLLKILECKKIELLEEFDVTKVDIPQMVSDVEFKSYGLSLEEYIVCKADIREFLFFVNNGYKPGYTFFEKFIHTKPSFHNPHDNRNTPKRVKIYCEFVNKSELSDDKKNGYYKKSISVASSFRCKTTLYDLLNATEDVSLFEYGLEMLLEQNNIIYFLFKLDNGYIPSKDLIKKLLELDDSKYVLAVIEQKYSDAYEKMLPYLF